MTEEVLRIGLISGISCPDGRHFQELVCADPDGKDVRVVVPTCHTCGEDVSCTRCAKLDDCEMQDSYEIDLGRKLIIKR
jgi:hypothetical protein